MCRARAILFFVILGSSSWMSTFPCVGQEGPLGGLLRDLIESELQRRQAELRTQQVPRPAQRPGTPREFAPHQREVQRLCNSIATESNRLVSLCQSEARRVPGLRGHMDELQKVAALARQLHQDFGQPMPSHLIVDELQRLDNQWRLSKYHLQQTRGLPDAFQRPIAQVDQYLTQSCDLFDIAPTINGRELVRQFEALSTELHHLGRDLRFVRSPAAQALTLELRRLETRAHLIAESVAGGANYDSVVAEFQAFGSAWGAMRVQLDTITDVHLARSVEEVQLIESAIREQLWLPRSLDVPHVQRLASLLDESLSGYLTSINVRALLDANNAPQILRLAEKLERETQEFCTLAIGGSELDPLVRGWEQLDTAWREMDREVRPIERPRTSEFRLKFVSEMTAIRNALGIQLIFDREQVRRYAAQLAGIADQQAFHVAQWQARPNSRLAPGTVRSVNQLVQECNRLQSDCAGSVAQQQLYDRCEQVTQSWVSLRPQLIRCETVDRAAIVRVADSMTDCLVHLQTLLQM